MTIVLDHTIVPARDKAASARFFAEILDLVVGAQIGPFVPVRVNGELTLDYEDRADFDVHHYAFVVDDATFDAALARLRAKGTPIGSDPYGAWDGSIEENARGRRVYFQDPDGHAYELMTHASV